MGYHAVNSERQMGDQNTNPPAAAVPEASRRRRGADDGMKDLIFGTAFYALLGYAGYLFFGPIEGVALWRLFALASTTAYAHGWLVRHRHGTEERDSVRAWHGRVESES